MKSGSSLRRILFVLLALIALLVMALGLGNRRGRIAWEKSRRALEARGERLDWREFVPPPVPDDQNFARTPLLVPLFDFVSGDEGHLFPRDTNAVARIEKLFASSGYLGGGWWRGKFADFNAWQAMFRGFTNEFTPTLQDWKLMTQFEPTANMDRSGDQKTNGTADYPVPIVPIAGPDDERLYRSGLRENPAISAWLSTPPAASAADDMLALLRLNSAELEELCLALKRPYGRFDIRYELEPERQGLPHLGILKKFANTFAEKALAELATGDPASALEDVLYGLALADTIRDEPLLISGRVREAMIINMIQPVWEGLARRQWNAEQLATLQSRFERINQVEDLLRALRGQRAMDLRTIDTILRRAFLDAGMLAVLQGYFGGWIQKYQASYAEAFQKYVLPPYDPTNRSVDVVLSDELAGEAESVQDSDSLAIAFNSTAWVKSYTQFSIKVARAQVVVDLAAIACALERFRMVRGAYPERLELLSPDFMRHVPCDPVNAQPLKYRRTDAGQFVLYSVGWNGVDDGGQYVLNSSGLVILGKSDWIWRYPPKQEGASTGR